ncbi:MAG TPA: hypothetical protein VG477_11290, partial [Thermoanaerobaculia bacterium]|nr:hypothetical protein [Thermoanaerobaculia bacterium]
MKARILPSGLLLCLVLTANPGLATTQGDGWTQVVPGVLQRSLGGHKVETLASGREGFVWLEAQLQDQLERLLEAQRLHPTADLEETLGNHRQQIQKIQQAIRSLGSKSGGTGAKAGCNVSYSAHANALAVVSAPGVRADADASLSNDCGAKGDTYAYAYAKANLNGTTTILTQSDLDTGGNVGSLATASAAGTTGCDSFAFASVTSVALGINYSVSDQSFACQF